MRSAIIASVLATSMAANLHDRAFYEEKFYNWLSEHKIEATSGEHFVKMIQNFANNDDFIATHNAKNLSYTLGHNQFSHMSSSEWSAFVKRGGLSKPSVTKANFVHNAPVDKSTVAASIDWVSKGAVTGVKDQGQCGSCWSFSTTGSLEGAFFNAGHALTSFSEQNLVDCDNRKNKSNKGTDMGCNGGLMDSAFEWIQGNGGLCTEADYPYTAKDGDCKTTCKVVAGSKISSFVDVKANSDDAMESALNVGPVSVAIEADQPAFQLYKSGVFSAACGTNLDHGVLAVGYGTDNGVAFYNVKNSWGASWGEAGYIRFGKGSSYQKEGQCGILSEASYAKV